MFRGAKRLSIAMLCGVAITLVPSGHLLSVAMPKQVNQNLITFPSQQGVPDPNDVFDAVNQARTAQGLPVLQKDAALTRVAQERAADMQKRAYYAHKNPDGLMYYDILFQQRVGFNYSCENLDLQFITPTANFVNDWMNSNTGHRECMLNVTADRAGYAITTIDMDNGASAYIVVAIHASLN